MSTSNDRQRDVIYEFIKLTNTGDGRTGPHISFSMRGGPGKAHSYVNVFGPSQDPTNPQTGVITVEPDGSLGVKDKDLAERLGARPAIYGVVPNNEGKSRGAATWELPVGVASTEEFVLRVWSVLKEHPSWHASK